jgi:hypothetical protein
MNKEGFITWFKRNYPHMRIDNLSKAQRERIQKRFSNNDKYSAYQKSYQKTDKYKVYKRSYDKERYLTLTLARVEVPMIQPEHL